MAEKVGVNTQYKKSSTEPYLSRATQFSAPTFDEGLHLFRRPAPRMAPLAGLAGRHAQRRS